MPVPPETVSAVRAFINRIFAQREGAHSIERTTEENEIGFCKIQKKPAPFAEMEQDSLGIKMQQIEINGNVFEGYSIPTANSVIFRRDRYD